MKKEKILFDELYLKTLNFRRVHFVRLLQKQEIEIMELRTKIKNLKTELSGKYDDLTSAYLMGYYDGKESIKKVD